MAQYIVRRILLFFPTLLLISLVSFTLIQLPPGDYLTTYVSQLAASGDRVDVAELAALEKRYGLNQPFYMQYLKWMRNLLQGDMGVSWEWNKPVTELIWGRLAFTVVISLASMVFIWIVGIPLGIY